jgi:cytoskeletal protein CcmA (bactofilin family)
MANRIALVVVLALGMVALGGARSEPADAAKPSCERLPPGPANAAMGDREVEDDPLVVGTNSIAGDLVTRGGLVAVGTNAQAGNIKTKSGPVLIGPSGTVAGISTESGSIEICGSGRVTGDVVTTTGSITLGMNADIGRIVIQKPAVPPANPPVIRLGNNSDAEGIELGYPVRICYGMNASAGGMSGAKPLPCKQPLNRSP